MMTRQELSENIVFWCIMGITAIILLLSTFGCNEKPHQPDIFRIELVSGGAEIVMNNGAAMIYHAPTLAETYSEDYRRQGICNGKKFLKDLYPVNHVRAVQATYDVQYGRLIEETDKF